MFICIHIGRFFLVRLNFFHEILFHWIPFDSLARMDRSSNIQPKAEAFQNSSLALVAEVF